MNNTLPKRMSDFRNRIKGERSAITKAKNSRIGRWRESLGDAAQLKRLYGPSLWCLVCKEARTIELCHIVPVRMNGHGSVWNLMPLCPTHHKLYDDAKLDSNELELLRDKITLGLRYHSLNMTNQHD